MDTISAGKRLTLHLGVVVQPYRSFGKRAGALTTYDVAKFLEAKYQIMETFASARVHGKHIGDALANSMAGALESYMMGRRIDPFGKATAAIDEMFRTFINSREAERVGIPGTPTMAAQRGVNHRLKHPYKKSNPSRPSFRDTGLYVGSFRSWVD